MFQTRSLTPNPTSSRCAQAKQETIQDFVVPALAAPATNCCV
ncbi:unnamed protein product [Ectocarpus sp. CCAP 1310/34]|nr:unnamed protein product [Ectocarpus sp. CCAP 1310/34]